MKIGLVTPFLTRAGGGVFTSVQCLAQALAAERNEVRVLGLEDPANEEDLKSWKPLPVEAFPVRGPRALGYAPGMGPALRRGDFEVVHAHGLWMGPSIAAHRAGKPGIVSPHGMLDPWALALSQWKKKLAAAAFQNAHLRGAACIHALCQSEAESIRAYGLRNPICVIPNGIDLPVPGEEEASFARQIPAGGKVLLYLGRLHPKKGLPALIQAWKAAGTEWHLVISGWDQAGHENELKALAAELRAERVIFAGPQFGSAKDAAYRRADAFILPSLSEGLPMVILEAWAHGKPVLMTEQCNLPEGFAAGAAMRIAPEVESIAQGLGEFTSRSETQLQEMGTKGRRLVEESFTWPTIAQKFGAVYEWVAGRGARPEWVISGG